MQEKTQKPVIRFCILKLSHSFFSFIHKKNFPVFIEHDFPFPLKGYIQEDIKKKYTFVYDRQNPDIVELAPEKNTISPSARYALAILARRVFGFRPMLMIRDGEYYPAGDTVFDRIFSSHPTHGKNICFPLGVRKKTSFWRQYSDLPKKKFCNYIYSNDWMPHTQVRRAFCQKLMLYKHVDCPGHSLKNMRLPDSAGKHPNPQDIYSQKLFFIKDYKFTIAFENLSASGYVTEKISDPFFMSSIPIYWGCPEISEYYNSRAFINCHEYKDFDAVIERIIEIDTSPKLYEEYKQAPAVLPKHHIYHVPEKIYKASCDICEEVLSRRSLQETRIKKNLRLLGIILKNLDKELMNIKNAFIPPIKHIYRFLRSFLPLGKK